MLSGVLLEVVGLASTESLECSFDTTEHVGRRRRMLFWLCDERLNKRGYWNSVARPALTGIWRMLVQRRSGVIFFFIVLLSLRFGSARFLMTYGRL